MIRNYKAYSSVLKIVALLVAGWGAVAGDYVPAGFVFSMLVVGWSRKRLIRREEI